MNKSEAELAYWSEQYFKVGFNNSWYEYFYTEHFGLTKKDYEGKKLLDVGCGPKGSLEWMAENARCFGLDPLCNLYYKNFDCRNHKTTYIFAPAEQIPFPDEYFDYIFSFNSLDHVDNVDETLSEISRVLAPGGSFLLIVEINHEPRVCEPHRISEDIVKSIEENTRLCCKSFDLHGVKYHDNGYKNIKERIPPEGKPRFIEARFIKELN